MYYVCSRLVFLIDKLVWLLPMLFISVGLEMTPGYSIEWTPHRHLHIHAVAKGTSRCQWNVSWTETLHRVQLKFPRLGGTCLCRGW